MPIHNEELWLPRSLGKLRKADITHFVALLDRCTDRSRHIMLKWQNMELPFKVNIYYRSSVLWSNPIAEAFEFLCKRVETDLIYLVNADHLVDTRIFSLTHWQNADLLSFEMQYPNDSMKHAYENILIRIYDSFNPKSQNGLLAFKRKVWESVHFEDSVSPSNAFIGKAIQHGFRHNFIKSFRNIHLHAKMTKRKQIMQGTYRATHGTGLSRTLFHSALHFEPYTIRGYVQGKKTVKP